MRKIILTLGAAVTMLFVVTPTAHADPQGYLNDLESRGQVIINQQQALKTGYIVCEALFHDTGDHVAAQLADQTDLSLGQAVQVVFAAVDELCPYRDHRRVRA